MKRPKLYPILSAAAIFVSVVAFDILCYLLWVVLEDHLKILVVTGSDAAYYSMVFSHPGVLACLAAVLGFGAAAIAADALAIRREERGSLILLNVVSLVLAAFALLFWLILRAT